MYFYCCILNITNWASSYISVLYIGPNNFIIVFEASSNIYQLQHWFWNVEAAKFCMMHAWSGAEYKLLLDQVEVIKWGFLMQV